MMMKKIDLGAAMIVGLALLLAGCESDDTPLRAGNSTVTVVNETGAPIHVAYQTQTWDVLIPGIDASHQANVDIAPFRSEDLSVHFDSELGTSRITVTKSFMLLTASRHCNGLPAISRT